MDVADNIDLTSVVQEFEDSYELKYGRRPKLIRKIVDEVREAYLSILIIDFNKKELNSMARSGW